MKYASILPMLVIILIVCIMFVYISRKNRLVKKIDTFYTYVKELEGKFIEKWDEDNLLLEGNNLVNYINEKKIKIEKATNFIAYCNSLPSIIYKNNIKALEENIEYFTKYFSNLSGYGSRYITSDEMVVLVEDYIRESKDLYDKSVKYDSIIIKTFTDICKNPKNYFANMNRLYIENEKSLCKEMFNNIEGKSLDDNQRNAVVNDDSKQLVVAGAGSGKTLTISAKVKYLVERKGLNPKDILLISFTKKAAIEMSDRIHRIGIDIESSTFHKYGLSILGKVDGKTPDVFDDIKSSIDLFLKDVIYTNEDDTKNFLRLLGILLLPSYKPNQSIGEMIQEDKRFDMTTLKGMYEANVNALKMKKIQEEIALNKDKVNNLNEKIITLTDEEEIKEIQKVISVINEIIIEREKRKLTIKNEKVKSREEVKIANILFLEGIEYQYEAEYPFDDKNNYRKHYRPDFYLKNDNVYLEHFGIDKDGGAKQYDEVSEQKYIDGMKWKVNLHKENDTKLIKTYSWQFQDNIVEDYLKGELKKYNIICNKIDYRQVVTEICKSENSIDAIDSLISLLITFVSLFKSNDYPFDKFDELIEGIQNSIFEKDKNIDIIEERNICFLQFAKAFYVYYTNMLCQEKKIDFNDMINQATKLINDNMFDPIYKYVVVDEYQDISMSRYKLVKATLEKSGAKLFSVGDDWQSIYRFTGSEVSLFVDFGKYFGLHSRTDIVSTYRNSQELLDIAGKFVIMNDQQIKKELKSTKRQKNPIKVRVYEQTQNVIYEEGQEKVIVYDICNAFDDALADIVNTINHESSVLVLGRNNRDIQLLKEHKHIEIKQEGGETVINHKSYPQLSIIFLTIHRSKGLEAGSVILLNMLNSRHGFPNQIADDPILDLLHDNKESYPFSEERRLFYVALTRTKNITYLLVPNLDYSRFLHDINAITSNKDDMSKDPKNAAFCPVCKTGMLLKRRGKENSVFVGCSNYPMCNYTINNISIVKKDNRCPICDNFMVKRIGMYGEFMGCLSYPTCTFTRQM